MRKSILTAEISNGSITFESSLYDCKIKESSFSQNDSSINPLGPKTNKQLTLSVQDKIQIEPSRPLEFQLSIFIWKMILVILFCSLGCSLIPYFEFKMKSFLIICSCIDLFTIIITIRISIVWFIGILLHLLEICTLFLATAFVHIKHTDNRLSSDRSMFAAISFTILLVALLINYFFEKSQEKLVRRIRIGIDVALRTFLIVGLSATCFHGFENNRLWILIGIWIVVAITIGCEFAIICYLIKGGVSEKNQNKIAFIAFIVVTLSLHSLFSFSIASQLQWPFIEAYQPGWSILFALICILIIMLILLAGRFRKSLREGFKCFCLDIEKKISSISNSSSSSSKEEAQNLHLEFPMYLKKNSTGFFSRASERDLEARDNMNAKRDRKLTGDSLLDQRPTKFLGKELDISNIQELIEEGSDDKSESRIKGRLSKNNGEIEKQERKINSQMKKNPWLRSQTSGAKYTIQFDADDCEEKEINGEEIDKNGKDSIGGRF